MMYTCEIHLSTQTGELRCRWSKLCVTSHVAKMSDKQLNYTPFVIYSINVAVFKSVQSHVSYLSHLSQFSGNLLSQMKPNL